MDKFFDMQSDVAIAIHYQIVLAGLEKVLPEGKKLIQEYGSAIMLVNENWMETNEEPDLIFVSGTSENQAVRAALTWHDETAWNYLKENRDKIKSKTLSDGYFSVVKEIVGGLEKDMLSRDIAWAYAEAIWNDVKNELQQAEW